MATEPKQRENSPPTEGENTGPSLNLSASWQGL